jgi:hypothetical protein
VIRDVDTLVSLHKYPYESSIVFLTSSIIDSLHGPSHFQDIDILGPKVFFHPLGPWGLFSFDERSHRVTELLPYGGGDHIAADSIFVFCDIGHTQIQRFNLVTNSVDLRFSREFSPPPDRGLAGLDVYNNQLYVLTRDSTLRVFDFEGALLDSMRCNSGFYITVHDSVIYGVRHKTGNVNTLTRFDLRTRRLLTELLAPSRSCDGIKVANGQLYYCDYYKRMVGVLPIAKLCIAQM